VRILFLSFGIVLADQITKLMVKGIDVPWIGLNIQGLQLGSSRPIFGDLVRLTYIENPGMAFGIDIGGKLFFSIFSIVASIGIIMYLYSVRNEKLGFRIALALILGGAVGNLIDRVFYGAIFNEAPLFYGRVVDFLDVDFFDIDLLGVHLSRWPVFNIADASVTSGVVLLLLTHRTVTQEKAVAPLPGDAVTAGEIPGPETTRKAISPDLPSPGPGE
jgi:signal peptidase II